MTDLIQNRIDATEDDFDRVVLEESRKRPVLVDFWAPWCEPCRVVGPILERLAGEQQGRFLLAKVNADEAPALSARFQIRGIPALKAFRDGVVIDELVGAQPEAELRAFIEGFVPGPADDAASEGDACYARGDRAGAAAAYARALALDPRHGAALLGSARIALDEGDADRAEHALDLLPAQTLDRFEAEVGALRLRLSASGAGDVETLRASVARSPDDLEARVRLGLSLAGAGQHEEALQLLLEVVKKSRRAGPGEDARKAMLQIFEAVGARSELADRFRDQLAGALY